MFRIRFVTPQVINEEGWQHLGGELVVGDARLWLDTDPDEPYREHRPDRRVEPARVAGESLVLTDRNRVDLRFIGGVYSYRVGPNGCGGGVTGRCYTNGLCISRQRGSTLTWLTSVGSPSPKKET